MKPLDRLIRDDFEENILQANSVQYLTNLKSGLKIRKDFSEEKRHYYIGLVDMRLREVFKEGYKNKVVTYP